MLSLGPHIPHDAAETLTLALTLAPSLPESPAAVHPTRELKGAPNDCRAARHNIPHFCARVLATLSSEGPDSSLASLKLVVSVSSGVAA